MRAFLNADARRAVHVGQQGIAFLHGQLGSLHELGAFGGTDGAAAEGAHEQGDDHLGAVQFGFKGDAAALELGAFPRFGEAHVEAFEVQRIGGFHFAVELADGPFVEHVLDEPLVFHREVVPAPCADAREFAVQIRGP